MSTKKTSEELKYINFRVVTREYAVSSPHRNQWMSAEATIREEGRREYLANKITVKSRMIRNKTFDQPV